MGLFRSLNIGSQSLYATRQGMDTTAHNIANAQTEGYSRQNINFAQRDPSLEGGVLIGNGNYVGDITRAHDRFLEHRLNIIRGQQGNAATRFEAMQEMEGVFSPQLNSSVSQEISNFFTSLQALSNFPEELTTRTAVREQAQNLISAFRGADRDLRNQRDSFNEHIKATADTINNLLHSIATLNTQIREQEIGQNNVANDLRDQRDKLVGKLAELTEIHYYDDQNGMVTIRGPGQSLLVERGKSGTIQCKRNFENDEMYDLYAVDFENSTSRNITNVVGNGKLKALLDVRDNVADNLIHENNLMAQTFAERFNEIHREGFGLNQFGETTGRNFFEEISDPSLAAQNLALDTSVINSTDAISCGSSRNASGDNIIVNRLLGMNYEKVLQDGTATFAEYYSNYVGTLGIDALRSKHVSESSNVLLADLKSRREATSGVSLDEEAANMIRWQNAFTASSKVITTIDEMIDVVINLKR